MLLDAVDDDGRDGTHGAEIFASATTDAALGIDNGGSHTTLFIGLEIDHIDGASGTMTSAVSAAHSFGSETIILDNACGTDLDARFLSKVDEANGIVGTNFGTTVALGTAVAALVLHDGLHECVEISRGTQHTIGTSADAELARSAMLRQVARTLCARRNESALTLRNLLILNGGKTTIDLLFCLSESSTSRYSSSAEEEGTTTAIWGVSRGSVADRIRSIGFFSFDSLFLLVISNNRILFVNHLLGTISNAIRFASLLAIAADNAAAIVDGLCIDVNAMGLAVVFAKATALAAIGIDDHFHPRETTEETEERADGTNGVAIAATAGQGEGCDDNKRNNSNEQ